MLNQLLSVSRPCDQIVNCLKIHLLHNGLKVLQTFELHDVLLGSEFCPCPNHETEKCDCEMVVLLVYGSQPEPVTIVLHGSDGETWVSLADGAEQMSNESTVTAVKRALEIAAHT